MDIPVCWLTSPKLETARIGPGQSQEHVMPPGSPVCLAGARHIRRELDYSGATKT